MTTFSDLAGDPFEVLMADPPWEHVAFSAKGHAKAAQAHYDCMSIEQILALPVKQIAARNCWLWLWATNPMLPHAFRVLDAWGFRYSTKMTWVKTGSGGGLAYGTGKVLRGVDEPILIARRGNPRLYTKGTPTVFFAEAREHSRKPDCSYTIAEAMFGQYKRKLDMFSRESRPGWTSWGDEAGKFDGAAR